jgi:hypothetical protein
MNVKILERPRISQVMKTDLCYVVVALVAQHDERGSDIRSPHTGTSVQPKQSVVQYSFALG